MQASIDCVQTKRQNKEFFCSMLISVGREEKSFGLIGANVQSNRGGFAQQTIDITNG